MLEWETLKTPFKGENTFLSGPAVNFLHFMQGVLCPNDTMSVQKHFIPEDHLEYEGAEFIYSSLLWLFLAGWFFRICLLF